MKLSIIPIDGTVCENGICFTHLSWTGTPVNIHALQWDTDSGWLEFNDGSPNELITELPVWTANAKSAWDTAANPPPPPTPTPEEIAEQNKQQAKSLLAETDYVNESDVIDPSRNPHLLNQAEFLTYREQIRKIAVNPPSFVIENWPVKPTNVWSS